MHIAIVLLVLILTYVAWPPAASRGCSVRSHAGIALLAVGYLAH